MKKFIILALMLTVPCFAQAKEPAKPLPVYTDDIPVEYINKVKNLKNVNLKQTLPVYNTENMHEVKIHSEKKIQVTNVYYKNSAGLLDVKQSYQINDKVKFIVAQDVIKNGKVYIKQGSEAIGVFREARIGQGSFSAPDELQISLFTTKDVNGNKVDLYGSIVKEGKETGLFQMLPLISAVTSINASVSPREVFTLYCN